MKTFLYIILFCFSSVALIAQTATIKGIVLDQDNNPIENVTINFQDKKTISNANGFYLLTIPANVRSNLKFSHLSQKAAVVTLQLKPNEDYEFNIVLKNNIEQIGEIIITNTNNRKRVEGVTSISPQAVRLIPGANPGVENILKSLPGVNSNNELSTQYAVRGGNYDENLVYVNDIEIYRPFLIRSGQQEGLSFANTNLIQNIEFSAGGFQAKYGDKLSSVLDINYRKPTKFGASAELSFLGANISVDQASKNKKWTAVTGVRYRDNSLLVKSQQTQTNFKPSFADIQTYISFTPNAKWSHNFLGNISQNRYHYQPITRQTNFGTITQPTAISIFYEGQEKDKYQTVFGAYQSIFTVNKNCILKFIGSAYHTIEEEYFDILAQYKLGAVNSNLGSEDFGKIEYSKGIGSQFTHARNDLDALIINTEIKGIHKIRNSQVEWGAKYTHENIRDKIREWEVVDSIGFSLPNPIILNPIQQQPYTTHTGPLVAYNNIRAQQEVSVNRFSVYLQYNTRFKYNTHSIFANIGFREQHWQVQTQNQEGNAQITFSPRAQIALKPNWTTDMLFKLSGGLYHQPPFYRELRNAQGNVLPNVKAQQAIHLVLSNDYSFSISKRPFKLVTELYYKTITNLNTYTIDNVRIRYQANNNAIGYATGADIRLNGEFVPGTESWLSFGYLKTQENQDNKGYIDRPTDQRLKFGILFQDYIPNIPACKVYLNLVYNTGLPGGSPSYANPYDYQLRLKDYRRADAGFSYVFTDRVKATKSWLKNFKEFAIGLEIFNMFNNQNSITNTWVRDVYSKTEYGVPNYLTARVFSLKWNAKL